MREGIETGSTVTRGTYMKPAPPVMRMFLGVYSVSAVLVALPLDMMKLRGDEEECMGAVLRWKGRF